MRIFPEVLKKDTGGESMKYTYQLHKGEKALHALYNREELERLTTLQLREICKIEKIVIGVAYKLDRNYMIDTILKYRGQQQFEYIQFDTESRNIEVFQNLKSHLKFINAEKQFKIPVRIAAYLDNDITLEDQYIVTTDKKYGGNVLLLDEQKNVCGIWHMVQQQEQNFLISDHNMMQSDLKEAMYKNYSLGFLEEATSRTFYAYYHGLSKLSPTQYSCYTKTISELFIARTTQIDTTLVIDFGTSNTALGAYMDERQYTEHTKKELLKRGIQFGKTDKVTFETTVQNGQKRFAETLPTVISIKDCSDSNNITYRYGYDAVDTASKNSYGGKASIFYEIKKWINSYQKIEEVYDEKGNIAFVARKEILKQYFYYIIKAAEQRHKCKYKKLHITSPIRQKQQFLAMYQEILGEEYEILTTTALDEGIAVLYNSISNQIENANFYEGEQYKALVIDCGGGTTDLTSCIYTIEDNHITYKLHLKTIYANGDIHFGGNNITYRIMQYLKVLFSNYYAKKQTLSISDIIQPNRSEIYGFVDEFGKKALYESLEKQYLQCENSIPTQFAQYKELDTESYNKVRSNFYFLWNLAESIKLDFYSEKGITRTVFHKQGIKKKDSDTKVIAEQTWKLNINQANLQLVTDLPEIIINKQEIDLLLKGDIYNIIKKFVEPLYDDDLLQDYSFIKLTGQTSRIDLFRDAMKEYMAGKMIETAKSQKTAQHYKLSCVEGAIQYENAKKIGLIAPTLTDEVPITPYQLTAFTYNGTEVVMMSSFEKITKTYGFISKNIETETIDLLLKNQENVTLHIYQLILHYQQFEQTTYEQTSAEYADKILQDDIDNIADDEMKLFTFSYGDKWGFYTLPIARKEGQLLIGQKKYFPFESDEWESSFFDGTK